MHKKRTLDGEIGRLAPPGRGLAIGTLRGILRQAHVKPGEFMANL